jgi:hypothetical protein
MAEEYYVRPPDSVIRERLIANINCDRPVSEEEKLSEIVAQSELDYELQLAMEESERDEALRQIFEYRKTHFTALKRKFAQFQQIDKSNARFYELILSHISEYELGTLTRVEVDVDFYNKLINTLGNMRAPDAETHRILEFIVLQDS